MQQSRRWLSGLFATAVVVAGFAAGSTAPATAAPASTVAAATPLPASFLELAGGAVVDTAAPKGTPPTLTKQNAGQFKQANGTVASKQNPATVTSAKAGGVTTMAACSSPCFYYAGYRDTETKPGIAVNMSVAKPTLAAADYHALGEMAVSKVVAGKTQHVEVGYTVDPVVNAGSTCTPKPACLSDPHLFTFAWVNDVPLCYNGCGFVKNTASTIQVGASLASGIGTSKWAKLYFYGGNWWVGWDGQWLGYWPNSLWTGASPAVTTFTDTAYQTVFGESVLSNTSSCTDMGTGAWPVITPAAGATMGSFNKLDASGAGTLDTYNGAAIVTNPAKYTTVIAGTGYTFRYGGPGDC